MPDDLWTRFHAGDRLALARLLSHCARGEPLPPIDQNVATARPSRVVAITGSAGVGKSTLLGKLIEHVRDGGSTVAVLACDPQSPKSGGALLGDRFRMPARPTDDGVFIRSLAAVGGEGAVARHMDSMVRLLEAFGFGVIFLETVGAGQGDTAVCDLADVVVVLVQPETGDDLQWEKAGVLEVADIVVVHKGDLPHAEQVEAQVRAMLLLSPAATVPVVRASAKTGDGIESLWEMIQQFPLRRGAADEPRVLLRHVLEMVAARFAAGQALGDAAILDALRGWRSHELSTEAAADLILRQLAVVKPE